MSQLNSHNLPVLYEKLKEVIAQRVVTPAEERYELVVRERHIRGLIRHITRRARQSHDTYKTRLALLAQTPL